MSFLVFLLTFSFAHTCFFGQGKRGDYALHSLLKILFVSRGAISVSVRRSVSLVRESFLWVGERLL